MLDLVVHLSHVKTWHDKVIVRERKEVESNYINWRHFWVPHITLLQFFLVVHIKSNLIAHSGISRIRCVSPGWRQQASDTREPRTTRRRACCGWRWQSAAPSSRSTLATHRKLQRKRNMLWQPIRNKQTISKVLSQSNQFCWLYWKFAST